MVAVVFLVTGIVFYTYIVCVQRRQNTVMAISVRSSVMVSSLFPENVRDRVMEDAVTVGDHNSIISYGKSKDFRLINSMKKNLGESGDRIEDMFVTKPVADLFSETTVMFADLVGFTGWSSAREPSQVFQLLETIYHVFDLLAPRHCVFKLETGGDCYVAVTGFPDPRIDHAVLMVRFARHILSKFEELTKKL